MKATAEQSRQGLLDELVVLVKEHHVGGVQGRLELEELVQSVTPVDRVEVFHCHGYRKVNTKRDIRQKQK